MKHFFTKFHNRLFCLLCLALLGQAGLNAYGGTRPTTWPDALERTLSGKITDGTGAGIPGATVIIRNNARVGTTADANGLFTLKVPDGVVTLVVSSIGYEAQEVRVNAGQTTVDVSLKADVRGLGEVVVVGYGTQNKRNITSAISQVKGAELREINAPGLDQALQGRAAGVQVVKNTGAPGGGISIRIRGTASLLGGQEPLYIVDGIPINNTPTGSADVFNTNRNGGIAGNEFVNPISQISMEDIENIEILKDAASASIYGARAANGVVLITTKKGKAGKLEVSLNGYTGFGEVAKSRRYQLLSGPEFAQAANLARRLRNTPIAYPDSVNVASTDWQEEIFQRGIINNFGVGVNGGTERVRFSFSAGYFKQAGTIIGTDFNRINLRNNVDFNVSKNVKAGINMMISRSNSSRLRNTGIGTGTDNFNNNNLYGPSVLGAGGYERNPAGPKFASFEGFMAQQPTGDKPFFFWIGPSDPHRPYAPELKTTIGLQPQYLKVPAFLPDSPDTRTDLLDYYAEVARFEKRVQAVVDALEKTNQLTNTVLVITGDNGMPFPRAKANLYDAGTRIPLIICDLRAPKGGFTGGQRIKNPVSLVDLAPTWLELANLPKDAGMVGQSLTRFTAGRTVPEQPVFVERERHAQVRAENLSYPARAIRTTHFLYIQNLKPDRWPAGDPVQAVAVGRYGDIDNGPTKTYLVQNQRSYQILADAALAKRPAEELYELHNDPNQLTNVAGKKEHRQVQQKLKQQLRAWQKQTQDPRLTADGEVIDTYPYYGEGAGKN